VAFFGEGFAGALGHRGCVHFYWHLYCTRSCVFLLAGLQWYAFGKSLLPRLLRSYSGKAFCMSTDVVFDLR
jgi:hypothetical protein